MRRSKSLITFLVIFFIISVLRSNSIIAANYNNQSATLSGATHRTPGAYCGVSCLYVLSKCANKEIDYKKLLTREYIGSTKGSSVAQLKKAAEDYGLYAVPVAKLTSKILRLSDYPIILHVKPTLESRDYDHFELFIRTKDGQALLLDPPGPLRLVPFHELAPRWDGNGLIVSPEPIDISAVIAASWTLFVIYAVIAIAVIFAGHWTKRLLPKTLFNSRSKLLGLSMTQGAAFATVALLCGMLYHFANDTGLLANENATAAIQQAHAGNFIPKIGEKKVHKLLGSDAIFIDARFARDYKAGHLDGAISVPVDANDVVRQKVTADISKDSRIVMYCQSSRCKYAEIVAIKLKEDGYSNISIFRGGWAEWVAKNGKKEETS